MAELSTSSDGLVAEEARQQEPGQGSSGGSHGLQDTKEQEIRKGKAALVSTELLREDLVQSAVTFLKHPKVVASSDGQRRSFLENKGLTMDEIDEAFRRLQSPSSNSVSSDMCTSQGVSDHSCRITEESRADKNCMDDSERLLPEAEPVAPVVPRHPKSYMEIMEMIQRGERPDDIQDINDDPPNPDQPISEPRMAPKPKPWEKQGQGSSAWDLKSPQREPDVLRSEVQHDGTNKATELADDSQQGGDSLLQAEVAAGSESPATPNEATSSPE
ncbi:peroxisomal membrane protein PEX14 isoform X2 [Sorghum bicolor]|uniref:peroxisomal membrane protein PEX14 isoform X2 n=1 Tax=Sorghum bicolor TaxID=4558 RepID=UPI000B424ACC|nr:peroxisomal membrane protein PEX14 isoform X2 [Sorghum bicolor]|eukprot:XP_021302454.1 peroxisomal membrane protein PEX14 isoform X2 [Sorghum bicolor]